jgi:NAD(P)H dehydrogenase (quinone)
MKIAVTGATGNLGYHVVNSLLEKLSSQDVIAVVRNEAKAAGLGKRGAVVRVAAYGDPDALKKGLVEALLSSKNA